MCVVLLCWTIAETPPTKKLAWVIDIERQYVIMYYYWQKQSHEHNNLVVTSVGGSVVSTQLKDANNESL